MLTRSREREGTPIPLLLAPGGDPECVKAALLAGADAVYLGLPRFNARMRAANIEQPALEGLLRLAHAARARVYLTMNTLLTEGELSEACETAESCAALGVDAVIVQDWGLLAALAELRERGRFAAEIHASTQMTTHNSTQLPVLAGMGVSQVILARELSLGEVGELTARARSCGMRTEAFVHGAYCVSVSGQCTMSSAMAGRSGNRGECAQPCRRRYRDARGASGYPLSLRDMSLYASLAELARAGVGALKIEGRMKGADYVTTVVGAYRRELDRIARGEPPAGSDPSLSLVFNRGFHDGYLRRNLCQEMFSGEPFDLSLRPLGAVRGFTADAALLRLESPVALEAGALLSILTPDRALQVCKARVLRVVTRDTYEVSIEGELKGKILRSCLVYLHPSLPEVEDALRRIGSLEAPAERVDVRVQGREGAPLRLVFRGAERSATVEAEGELTVASRHGLDEAALRAALGRLGGTRYVLGSLDCSALEPGLFLPVSRLNEARRRAIEALSRREPPVAPALQELRRGPPLPELPRLGVIISDPAQAPAFEREGALVFFEVGGTGEVFDPELCIPVFPAVVFDSEVDRFREVARRSGVRAVVSDNVGLGRECAREGVPWIAGPRANVTNSRAVEALRDRASASAFFHSPEADLEQIRAQRAREGMPSLLVVAGPMLLMTTPQCIVRNLDGCARKTVEPGCLPGCARRAVMRDEGGRPFYVEKRPGRHTEVYNGSILWYPRAIRLLADRVSCFVLDLRDLSFYSLSLGEKLDMLHRCRGALEGNGDEDGPPRGMELTRGGFARGL